MALEIRPRRFGFVVLEGTTLLDSGVRGYREATPMLSVNVEKKAAVLLEFYQPGIVVIRERQSNARLDFAQPVRATVQTVFVEAKRRSIEAKTVSARSVQTFFAERGYTTKYAIASVLAEWFEELVWKLPPKRKPWQSERYNGVVFDAAATAVAFLANE